MLSSSKTGEVSQNSFVFKLADRQIDRETTATATTTTSTTTLHYTTLQQVQIYYATLHNTNDTTQHKLHLSTQHYTNYTTTTTATTTTTTTPTPTPTPTPTALNFPFLKDVSPKCFVSDVVNLEK